MERICEEPGLIPFVVTCYGHNTRFVKITCPIFRPTDGKCLNNCVLNWKEETTDPLVEADQNV